MDFVPFVVDEAGWSETPPPPPPAKRVRDGINYPEVKKKPMYVRDMTLEMQFDYRVMNWLRWSSEEVRMLLNDKTLALCIGLYGDEDDQYPGKRYHALREAGLLWIVNDPVPPHRITIEVAQDS